MTKPDERSRAWTRAEDYWPPARLWLRSARRRPIRPPTPDGGDPTHEPRVSLGILPYFALMLSLAILAVAIMIAAWPGRHSPTAPAMPSAPQEVGTAQKGWLQGS